MGGIGSGTWYRWDKKPVLENFCCININCMVKLGAIRDECHQQGGWVWSDRDTGEKRSSIGYECNTLDKDNSYIRLFYTITDTKEEIDYEVQLSRTTPHYGGTRFWFICPVTGKRVTKLYRVPCNGNRFVSRYVFKLNYRSQMESDVDRAISKKWKIVHKTDGHTYPVRPKGMHQKTFERILNKYWRQEEECLSYMCQYIDDMKEKYQL